VRRADNLATFVCRLSRNVSASTSCNTQDLKRDCLHIHLLLYSDPYRHAARIHTYILSYMVVLNSFGFGLNQFLEHLEYKKGQMWQLDFGFERLGED